MNINFFDSLLDSIHGGSYARQEGMTPLDQQVQLFAPAGAIKFPLPESDAWTEKVSSAWAGFVLVWFYANQS